MRILIVDDNEMVRDLLYRFLIGPDREIDTAHSYQTALRLAETNHYDLLTLDINLTDGCGLDLLANLRENENFSAKVFIIAGAGAIEEHSERICELKADSVFSKPFDWHELQLEIEKIQKKLRLQASTTSSKTFVNDKGES